MSYIRVAELWAAILTRLRVAEIAAITGGTTAHVYLAASLPDMTPPAATPWSRLVLSPVTALYPAGGTEGTHKQLQFLLRSEHNDFKLDGYQPLIPLEALQAQAFARLHRWAPENLQHVQVLLPLACTRSPQGMPVWDNLRNLWVLSSEWTTHVMPN